jgi:UDP-N-acetylmuramate--alanine ligase
MRDAMFGELEKALRDEDEFILLPPFYAGGTSSFRPTSQEVIMAWQRDGNKKYLCYASRSELAEYLQATAQNDDIILIMGARDNSLSDYAKSLTCS